VPRTILAILLLALGAPGLIGASSAADTHARDPARENPGLGSPAPSQESAASVTSGALTYYSDCVNEAKDHFNVDHLDRHLLYRCYGEVAVGYFNYLGRRHTPDLMERQASGVFIFRAIRGKGRCWNKIADEAGQPMSDYGCYLFEEI
jgi:hypothetical protein